MHAAVDKVEQLSRESTTARQPENECMVKVMLRRRGRDYIQYRGGAREPLRRAGHRQAFLSRRKRQETAMMIAAMWEKGRRFGRKPVLDQSLVLIDATSEVTDQSKTRTICFRSAR